LLVLQLSARPTRLNACVSGSGIRGGHQHQGTMYDPHAVAHSLSLWSLEGRGCAGIHFPSFAAASINNSISCYFSGTEAQSRHTRIPE